MRRLKKPKLSFSQRKKTVIEEIYIKSYAIKRTFSPGDQKIRNVFILRKITKTTKLTFELLRRLGRAGFEPAASRSTGIRFIHYTIKVLRMTMIFANL